MTEILQGNRMYLSCSAHPDTEHSLMLGMRRSNGYGRAPSGKEMQNWYDEHEKCPGGLDKFKLAHQHTPNWDCTPVSPETSIGAAVKLALVK